MLLRVIRFKGTFRQENIVVTFISLSFYLLLVIVMAAYFIVPLKFRWFILLLGSLAFYVCQGIEMLPLMLGASLIGWIFGLGMDKIYARDSKQKAKAKLLSGIAIVLLIGILAFVKSARYMPETLAERIIVPIGISYYTFSIISYLVDVYRKKYKAEQNFLKFTLFVAYFPKILQGPIARYEKLMPQLLEGHPFEYQRFCHGLQLMLWGFFKKIVIADRLSIFTGAVFLDIENMSGSVLLVAAIFATFELYCDFSACMDLALGISQIFGIELEKNFDHPFFSKSAAEFWRRWHITLGAWFKDYVYMTIVTSPRMAKLLQAAKKHFGTRFGKSVMVIVPLSAVWILTGVWHGTGWAYVVWGIYWGVLIIASQVFAPEIKKLIAFLHINVQSESWKIFQMVRTFALFMVGRMITIPNNLATTGLMFKKMFRDFRPWQLFDETLYTFGLDRKNFILVLFLFLLLWGVSMLQEKGSLRLRISEYNIVFRWMIYYIAIVAIVVLGIYGPGYDASSFVYIGF